MKSHVRLSLGLAALLILATPLLARADCSDAEELANDAHTHARRAANSDSLSDMRYYLDLLMDVLDETMDAAEDCDCPEAEDYAEEAYDLAAKAYEVSELEDALRLARQAMQAANDALRAAVECDEL